MDPRTVPTAAIAGYWDRAAIQMSGAQQFVASAAELGGEDSSELIAEMRAVQAKISANRARWQGLLPKGFG
jgi:hypothetical protein